MESVARTMMAMIAKEIGAVSPMDCTELTLTEEQLAGLYKLSKAHDLSHLISAALPKSAKGSETAAKFKKQTVTAVYRYEQLNYELCEVSDALEAAGIRSMALKGSLIRKYYPEPWMRTSCDIDVLVDESELDRAIELLCTELGYTVKGEKNYHDISLFSESGVHLELHFNILENMDGIDGLLSRVWEYAVLQEGKKYTYEQTAEYLAFHTLAHGYYHFSRGGCGVRTFMDLYLLERYSGYDREKLGQMCAESGLSEFYAGAIALCDVWFCGGEHTSLTSRMENFILRGGAYGTHEARVEIEKGKTEGGAKYLLYRIFMPYSQMRSKYPTLIKHKWLYPFFTVRRWFEMIFKGKLKRSVRELKKAGATDAEKRDSIASLMDDLGVKS